MKYLAVLVLLSVLPASASWAVEPVGRLRDDARSARVQVSELRAQQAGWRSELSRLAVRIEALKAEAKGPLGRRLLAGTELEAALRQSQELSEALTAGTQALVAREAELERVTEALVERLGKELEALGAAFDAATDRQSRRSLVERRRALRAERDELRASLPAPRLPSLAPPARTDDPYELLAQADLYRDSEDKLRRELERLDRRIRERREERELDRRVQRFLGEEALFDDFDRRLRVERASPAQASSAAPGGAAPQAGASPAADPSRTGGEGAPAPARTTTLGGSSFGEPAPGSRTAPPPPATAPPPAGAGGSDSMGSASGAEGSVKTTLQRAADARPQLGGGRAGREFDDADVEALEGERSRVSSLVDALRRQAAELEARARALR